ncbi:MAG: sigma factor [Candidatus Limiplasma sp.]|nr:sigma factor [Candidatus Limiplasma sp.]
MDEESFCAAVQEHQQMLYRVAYTLLGNGDDCADALQEALLRAWKKLHTLREPAAFQAWITRIVVNCSKDLLRRRRPPTAELTEDMPAPFPPPGPDVPLAQALAALKEELRLPITLYYMEGMSVTDIAGVMRIPRGTVKNRLMRGRHRLAVLLKEEESGWR